MTIEQRAFQCMMGMAIGDAISWPAMFHRSYLLPPWTRRIRREIESHMESSGVNKLSMPFSLNQPASVFNIGPTDDCEWAAFTAQRLLAQKGITDKDAVATYWLRLAGEPGTIRGPVSVLTALSNIRNGILPPASGHDNPHYFDDAALCRVVPIAIVHAGQPQRAAEDAGVEAAVTHSQDGIWTAGAFAAAVSSACGGGQKDAVIDAALTYLPKDSWSYRLARQSLDAARQASSILEIVPLINESIINREYNYGSVAPETLAVTLAIVQICGGDFERAITAACAFPKTADSVPAQTGALCAAMTDQDFLTDTWLQRFAKLKGICLPQLNGLDFVQLSRNLAALATKNSAG